MSPVSPVASVRPTDRRHSGGRGSRAAATSPNPGPSPFPYCHDPRLRERRPATISVAPTGRQRPVCPAFDPRVQVLNLAIKVPFVGLPCHAVHAGRGVTLHRVKRRPQHSEVDMVQERGELLLFLCLAASLRGPAPVTRFPGPPARRVLCWSTFPLVPVLGSTGSAADRSASFVSFVATTTESDFSGSCIVAMTPRLPDADLRTPSAGQTRDLPVPVQGASTHARVLDHAGPGGRTPPRALPDDRFPRILSMMSAAVFQVFSLRRLANALPYRRFDHSPRGLRRTAWGRCGLLLLHRGGPSPPTPCRFRRRTRSRPCENSG